LNEKEKKILLIAHRGANKLAPENTLKAFQKAIELKADYIEFDIHKSKDNEIVIMHDRNTFATTGHKGLIKRMTLRELKALDCGEGEEIPTLRELIDIAKEKIGLQIEVKAKGMTEQLVSILRDQSNLIETSLISSFQHDELLKIQRIEPNLKLAALEPIITGWTKNWEYQSGIIDNVMKNKYYAIHPRYQLINQEFINYCRRNNIKVNVWTVNSKAAMKKFIRMGVDGIITDDILRAKEVLNRD
jgi:glycerophosphoryl diester phosphodiesterase